MQGLPESGERKVIPKVACDQSQEGIVPLSSLGQLSSALVVHDVPTVRLAAHSQGMRQRSALSAEGSHIW